MSIQTQLIEYTHGGDILEGYLAYDETRDMPRPTILIAHAWEGRDTFVCEKAHKLAEMGYNAFALDMYGKGVLGTSPEENTALMTPFLENRQHLQERQKAGFAAAAALPQVDAENIAIMGYCFGGLCALDLARTGAALKGAVSFHGLLNAPGNTEGNSIAAKILILHGHKDPLVPPEQVLSCQEELTKADADWQIQTYGQAQHSFTNPLAQDASSGLFYSADADRRSWQALVNFLEELF